MKKVSLFGLAGAGLTIGTLIYDMVKAEKEKEELKKEIKEELKHEMFSNENTDLESE